MILYLPIIVSTILLLYVKIQNNRKFTAVIQGFFDLRAFRRVIREDSIVRGPYTSLLLLNTAFVLSTVSTYLIYQRGNLLTLDAIYIIFGGIFSGIIGYYWLRKIIFYLISYFSEQPSLASEIQIYNSFFYQVIGILLLPLIVFLNFRLDNSTELWVSLFYNGVILLLELAIISIYGIKLIQEFRQTSQLKISGYYLFLYFCTLEILPLIALIMWFIG